MPEQKSIQLLTEADSAKYIGMSVIWMRKARTHRSGPPYIKIGKAIRYTLPDLDKFLETHRIKTK